METFKNERLTRAVNYLKSVGYISTAKELAEKMNNNRSYLSEMMTGYRPVSDKFIRELCRMFPELNPNFFNDEKCMMMTLPEDMDSQTAQSIINSLQVKPNSAENNTEMKALIENYVITIKYLQEHIKELSAIIANLTKPVDK